MRPFAGLGPRVHGAMALRARLAGKVLAQAVAVVEGGEVLRRAAAPSRLAHRRARQALGARHRSHARRQLGHRRRGRDRLPCTNMTSSGGHSFAFFTTNKLLPLLRTDLQLPRILPGLGACHHVCTRRHLQQPNKPAS